MWKVLIADDDRNFRYAMREAIPWEENGFTVAGEAVHGKQALEILRQEEIHILLTDMEMPLMNGVELTRAVREQYPYVIIVALSAFDDFSFVRESLKLGAYDYILKQEFDPQAIISLLKKLCLEHPPAGTEELRRENSLQELKSFLQGNAADIRKDNQYFKMLTGSSLSLCVVITNKEQSPVVDENAETPGEIQMICTIKDLPRRWIFLFKMARKSSGSEMLAQWNRLIKRIQRFFPCGIKIGLPDETCSYERLPDLFRNSIKALEERFYEPEQMQFHYSDVRGRTDLKESFTFDPYGGTEDLDTCLGRFEKEAAALRPKEERLNLELIKIFRKYASVSGSTAKESDFVTLYTNLNAAQTLSEKLEYVRTQINRLREAALGIFQTDNPEIRAVIDYMEKHYAEDITLSELAEYVGLSYNYLSILFKKEVGEGLSSYLNRIRIRHAMMLLKDPAVKVYEVAETVGYKNASYFTTTFKKICGQSVSAYRKGGSLSDE